MFFLSNTAGLAKTGLAPVFKGWNVWSVYALKDLHFQPAMLGVSADDRLRIFVEDAVRIGAPGAVVADPIKLKGSQVEILAGAPQGLTVSDRREDLPGTQALVLDGPSVLRYVRFFNHGDESKLNWPFDENFMLNEVFQPTAANPITSGPGPSLTLGGATDSLKSAAETGLAIGLGLLAIYWLVKN